LLEVAFLIEDSVYTSEESLEFSKVEAYRVRALACPDGIVLPRYDGLV